MPKKMDLRTRAEFYAAVRIHTETLRGNFTEEDRQNILLEVAQQVSTPGEFEPDPNVDQQLVLKWLNKPRMTKSTKTFYEELEKSVEAEEEVASHLLHLRNRILMEMLKNWSDNQFEHIGPCMNVPVSTTCDSPYFYAQTPNFVFWLLMSFFQHYMEVTPFCSPTFVRLGNGEYSVFHAPPA